MKTRSKVVELIKSWEGLNEKDGSYSVIIDTYNSYKGKFPRGTKMKLGWKWCACTWSALAIKLGYTDIVPIEISCFYLIEKAKKMGIWVEDDKFIPNLGDAVIYDWDDNGVGDCTGYPDHVGTVIGVDKKAGTITVMEGNYSHSVKKRVIKINGKYIRGFICPKYDKESKSNKSYTKVAKEVIAGKWGNGKERRQKLEAAGYDYSKVQKYVNDSLKNK